MIHTMMTHYYAAAYLIMSLWPLPLVAVWVPLQLAYRHREYAGRHRAN